MLKDFRVLFMGWKLGKIKFPKRLARMKLLPVIGNSKDGKGQLYNKDTFRPSGLLASKEIHKPKEYVHNKDFQSFIT